MSRQDLYDALSKLTLLPSAHGRTSKVLLVSDDPTTLELTARRMSGFAGRVLRAYDSGAAIALAQQELPDLIVLDLPTPEVRGFTVVEALRKHAATAHIPILIITAKQISAEDRAKLDGAETTILEKTEFDGDRFMAEVQRALASPAAAESAKNALSM